MSTVIQVNNVSKKFSGRMILENVSLKIEKGTTIGLVGTNGSGKSVLFKVISGFVVPDKGQVLIEGKQLGKKNDFPDNMGIFINSPGFIGLYSGFKNLEFLANIRGVIGRKEIIEAMRKVGLDSGNKTKVEHYSLGMKQKLGIAQAIMENQEIIVLDEPFNALDFKTYNDIKEIIRSLQAEGKTILLTSHHFDDIRQLCDTIYMIEAGKVKQLSNEEIEQYLQR